MLELVEKREENSRLSCQIELHPWLHGLTARLLSEASVASLQAMNRTRYAGYQIKCVQSNDGR